MDDNTTYLIGAALVLTFFLFSNGSIGALVKKRLKKGEAPEPICGCEHHLAFHTDDGVCKEQVPVPNGAEGGVAKYTVYDCTCQQYVGPYPEVSPKIMRELMTPPPAPEPYSQEK